MTSTDASTSASHPATDTTANTATSTIAQTQPVPTTEEHHKHGLGAVLDKIVHPHGHKEHKDKGKEGEAVAAPALASSHVEPAVPATASDGGAHLAPGGSAVGGIL